MESGWDPDMCECWPVVVQGGQPEMSTSDLTGGKQMTRPDAVRPCSSPGMRDLLLWGCRLLWESDRSRGSSSVMCSLASYGKASSCFSDTEVLLVAQGCSVGLCLAHVFLLASENDLSFHPITLTFSSQGQSTAHRNQWKKLPLT